MVWTAFFPTLRAGTRSAAVRGGDAKSRTVRTVSSTTPTKQLQGSTSKTEKETVKPEWWNMQTWEQGCKEVRII